MTVTVRCRDHLPECEGWLDKFSVGRGLFSSHRWSRRYAVVTHEGIGYAHRRPSASLRPAAARCFIPFACAKGGEVRLAPVFLLRGTDGAHFALSFADGGRRLRLLLRCDAPADCAVWTAVLSLFVSAGSASTTVPVAHPLGGRGARDPDACTPGEYGKVRRHVLAWDGGERARLVGFAGKSPAVDAGGAEALLRLTAELDAVGGDSRSESEESEESENDSVSRNVPAERGGPSVEL